MSVRGRRRRGLLLLALALACGGLAASHVSDRVRAVESRVGPLVPVLVAARDVPAEARLGRRDVALRKVPQHYAPPDALVSAAELAGARTSAALAAGSYITAGQLGGASRDRGPAGALRRGERAVEVGVAGGQALNGAAAGTRVDVLVSSEPRDGAGRTFVALEDVELLGLRAGAAGEESSEGSGEDDAAEGATATATLRVTLRQAVYLTAAQNFAREVRLLSRPPGDSRRAGRTVVGASGL